MRIAFVITRADDLGGAQVHVRDLSTRLTRLGHEVLVLAGPPGILTEHLDRRGVPHGSVSHLRRPIHPVRDPLALAALREKLAEFAPDLVSTHSSKAGFLGRVAGRSLGVPTLFTAHGLSFADGKPAYRRRFYRFLEGLVSPHTARIITVSDSDRKLVLREGVAPSDQVVTIRNAMPDVDAGLRADPGRSPPVLITVARMASPKDHPTLLRALARLLDLTWRLEVVGDGPLREEIEALAADLGLAPRVAFRGFREDVPRRLASAQAFALVTRWEGLPRSVLEAMRAGLPVVASDVGGVAEAVVDGETGYLVEREAVDELESRLRRLLSERDLRRRMGAAGRRRYEAHFRFDRLLREHLDLYARVTGESAHPRKMANGDAMHRPERRPEGHQDDRPD